MKNTRSVFVLYIAVILWPASGGAAGALLFGKRVGNARERGMCESISGRALLSMPNSIE